MKTASFALVSCALFPIAALALNACGTTPEPILIAPPPPGSEGMVAKLPPPPSDPLATRPAVIEGAPFVPEAPQQFDGPAGSKVWLFERHSLPLVSIAAVTSVGGAADPSDRPGLSWITADMLDEGAGKRDALAFSAAIEDLGAHFASSADRDGSTVRLDVLSEKLGDGLALLGDAIVRPRHDAKDFTRVSSLWKNALKARGDDAQQVARVVTNAVFFGVDSPFGRPADGTNASASKIRLADVERWHHTAWRPTSTTFVVVGDTTKAKVTELLTSAFAGWSAPKEAAPEIPQGPALEASPLPKAVIVDRPDAPQIVLSIVRSGVGKTNADLARLQMMNVALGGSFTSRLVQNLREAHGWTYGVNSSFAAQRAGGVFLTRTSIRTDAIADAMREAKKEIDLMAREGLSEDELTKVRSLVRADMIETYGSVRSIAVDLADSAVHALPVDQDRKDLESQLTATRGDIATLATKWLSLEDASFVLVGPRKAAEAALEANGIGPVEIRDAEGRVLGVTKVSTPIAKH